MESPYQLPVVLLYHRVVNESCAIGKFKIYVWEEKFRQQMQWLRDKGYQTITFSDLNAYKADESLDKKIVLTFDDGYFDNYTIALPILKEFGFKAVIYLVTGCQHNEWNLKEGEPELQLMNREQILEMQAYGIEFGGHTQHHVDLKGAGIAQQQKEIAGCYSDLEKTLGKVPLSFAYPYGAYNDETVKLVGAVGFKYGITTIFGPHNWSERIDCASGRIEVRPRDGLFAFLPKSKREIF